MDKALLKKIRQVILVGPAIQRRNVMRTMLFICFALLIVFVYGAPVQCQNDPLVDNMKTVDGNVVSVDIQNSRIVVKGYEVMTFSVPSGAKIINADGFDIELSDVAAGNYVTVDYHDDDSGLHIMNGMEVAYSS